MRAAAPTRSMCRPGRPRRPAGAAGRRHRYTAAPRCGCGSPGSSRRWPVTHVGVPSCPAGPARSDRETSPAYFPCRLTWPKCAPVGDGLIANRIVVCSPGRCFHRQGALGVWGTSPSSLARPPRSRISAASCSRPRSRCSIRRSPTARQMPSDAASSYMAPDEGMAALRASPRARPVLDTRSWINGKSPVERPSK